MGVVMGPFSATLLWRMLSMTEGGSGVPAVSMISTPASWMSQLNATPVASSTRLAASTSSGPVPSPRMSVTLCANSVLLLWVLHECCEQVARPAAEGRSDGSHSAHRRDVQKPDRPSVYE